MKSWSVRQATKRSAIKVSLGKYPLSASFETFFREGIEGGEMEIL